MMSDTSNHGIAQSELDELYARLPQQDVEEFYASYLQWTLQRRMTTLQDAIVSLCQQIDANTELMQQAQPSAVALATLARLRANGIFDVELLDRMLDRGEGWLDATMQRLDYCEQLDDFLSDDYEQWCKHALEGAYDWIDSMRSQAEDEVAGAVASPMPTAPAEETLTEATEELLLSRLTGDEAEDELSLLEITLKRPAMMPVEPQEPASEQIEPAAGAEQVLHEAGEAVAFEEEAGNEERAVFTASESELLASQEYITPEVAPAEEDSSTLADEQPVMQEFAPAGVTSPSEDIDAGNGEPPLQEFVSAGETSLTEDIDAGSEEPALQEFVSAGETSLTEDMDISSGEPPLQEFAPAGETSLTEDIDAHSEEPVIQEFITIEEPPAEEEAHSGAEEPVIQEYSAPRELPPGEETDSAGLDPEQSEEPAEYKEPEEHAQEVIPAQAIAAEEPAATSQDLVPQWEWMAPPVTSSSGSQADAQADEPKRRSNFLWRLLAKIWGR